MNLSCGCTKQLFQLLLQSKNLTSVTRQIKNQQHLYFCLPLGEFNIRLLALCEVLVDWKLNKALLISLDCQSVQWHSSNHTTLSITLVRAELSSFLHLPWHCKVGTGGAMTDAKLQEGSWVKIFEKRGNKRKIIVKLETGLWESWLEWR